MSARVRLRRADPAALATAACGGDLRAVARLISLVEDGDPKQLRAASEALAPAAGRATLIGLTGALGVGKSTLGDAIQVAKAGILEIADVFVVNKADRDGARQLARDLRQMLHLGEATPWQVPVVLTAAAKGEGVGDLLAAIERHGGHLAESGEGVRRRRLRAAREIEALALATFRQDLVAAAGGLLEDLAERVTEGGIGPHAAADKLVGELRHRA